MTISTTTTYNEASGTGAVLAFPFTFVAQDADTVKVYLDDVLQGSGYTVSLNSNQTSSPGGTVTFAAAPASGVVVYIERDIPKTQPLALAPYGVFSAAAIEEALDRKVLEIQELDRDRAVLAAEVVTVDADRQAGDAAVTAWAAEQIAMARGENPYEATSDASTVLAQDTSVARTLSSRFAEFVNVLDFIPTAYHAGIADGTNTTALTTWIQAAIDAAEAIVRSPGTNRAGAEVYFPRGIYLTGALTVQSDGVGIAGESKRNTILHIDADSSTDGVTFAKPTVSTLFYPGIRDIGVHAKTARSSVRDLVSFQYIAHVHIDNLDLYGGARYGLFLKNTVNVVGNSIYSFENLVSGLRIESNDNLSATTVRLTGMHVLGSELGTGPGIDIDQCAGCVLVAPVVDTNGPDGVAVSSIRMARGELTLLHPYFEGNTGWDLELGTDLTTSSSAVVISPTFRLNTRKVAGYGGMWLGRIRAGAIIAADCTDTFTAPGESLELSSSCFNVAVLGCRFATTSPPRYNGGSVSGYPGIVQYNDASDGLSVLGGYYRPQIEGGPRLTKSVAKPAAGSFTAGDVVMKTAPVEAGTALSKYVITGWIRVTTGSGHVLGTDWLEMRSLTGN